MTNHRSRKKELNRQLFDTKGESAIDVEEEEEEEELEGRGGKKNFRDIHFVVNRGISKLPNNV